MKFLFPLIAIPFFLSVPYEGCKKSAHNHPEELQVKVVAAFCAFVIVEVQGPDAQQWGMDWESYKNVFTVGNYCDLPSGFKVGDVFSCKLIEKPEKTNCMMCMGYMQTPPLIRNIQVLK